MFNEHDVIIPDEMKYYSSMPVGNSTDHHSTTEKNAPVLHTCEAKPNGKKCWHHADVEYVTTAWRDFQSETRWICKQCAKRLEDGTEVSLIARYAPLLAMLQEERQVAV